MTPGFDLSSNPPPPARASSAVHWVPVALGAGVAAYFALPVEPPPALVFGGLGAAVAAAALLPRAEGWRRPVVVRLALWGIVLLLAGLALAQARSLAVAGPVISGDMDGAARLTGRVMAVERRVRAPDRILLSDLTIEGLVPADTPVRARVSANRPGAAAPGDWVFMRAVLRPPPPPSAPGAHDFARGMWFARIGGVGYALGAPEVIQRAAEPPPWRARIMLAVADLRGRVASRLRDGMRSPEAGALAAALVVGDRGGVAPETRDSLRDSGLAHLLAISGLHMGLVAGALFVGARALMALSGALALRWPVKKVAAGLAMAGALLYLLLAGASYPTQRAFVMAALALAAVILDRRAISMRMVAAAALVVLILRPEALTGASFQLSFAAVTALVAFYELQPVRNAARRWRGWRRIAGYVIFLAATTLVASAATAPFILHHFGRVAAWSLLGNLMGVPITAFVVMPSAVVAMLLMPFGLEAVGLLPMEWGLRGLMAAARFVAGLPGAAVVARPLPFASLMLIVAGGLWLCLWVGWWRLAGAAAVAAGFAIAPLFPPPDVLVAGNGRLAGYAEDGRLWLSTMSRERYTAGIWAEMLGADVVAAFPPPGESSGPIRCDALGCVARGPGAGLIAFPARAAALRLDCARADVLIVPFRTLNASRCRAMRDGMAVDRAALRDSGGHAIHLRGRWPWLSGPLGWPPAPVAVTVADVRGRRPWTGGAP